MLIGYSLLDYRFRSRTIPLVVIVVVEIPISRYLISGLDTGKTAI